MKRSLSFQKIFEKNLLLLAGSFLPAWAVHDCPHLGAQIAAMANQVARLEDKVDGILHAIHRTGAEVLQKIDSSSTDVMGMINSTSTAMGNQISALNHTMSNVTANTNLIPSMASTLGTLSKQFCQDHEWELSILKKVLKLSRISEILGKMVASSIAASVFQWGVSWVFPPQMVPTIRGFHVAIGWWTVIEPVIFNQFPLAANLLSIFGYEPSPPLKKISDLMLMGAMSYPHLWGKALRIAYNQGLIERGYPFLRRVLMEGRDSFRQYTPSWFQEPFVPFQHIYQACTGRWKGKIQAQSKESQESSEVSVNTRKVSSSSANEETDCSQSD